MKWNKKFFLFFFFCITNVFFSSTIVVSAQTKEHSSYNGRFEDERRNYTIAEYPKSKFRTTISFDHAKTKKDIIAFIETYHLSPIAYIQQNGAHVSWYPYDTKAPCGVDFQVIH